MPPPLTPTQRQELLWQVMRLFDRYVYYDEMPKTLKDLDAIASYYGLNIYALYLHRPKRPPVPAPVFFQRYADPLSSRQKRSTHSFSTDEEMLFYLLCTADRYIWIDDFREFWHYFDHIGRYFGFDIAWIYTGKRKSRKKPPNSLPFDKRLVIE